MRKEWSASTYNRYDKPYDKELFFDGKRVASVTLYGDWWEAEFDCCDSNEYPDGARFRTQRGAMVYATKHATVMWIGGRYKERS